MTNDIYDSMLSAYDLSTEQKKRNAIFEVNQQIILAGLYNGGSSTWRHSMAVRVFAFSMVFNALAKTWISLFWHLTINLISRNISNQS